MLLDGKRPGMLERPALSAGGQIEIRRIGNRQQRRPTAIGAIFGDRGHEEEKDQQSKRRDQPHPPIPPEAPDRNATIGPLVTKKASDEESRQDEEHVDTARSTSEPWHFGMGKEDGQCCHRPQAIQRRRIFGRPSNHVDWLCGRTFQFS